MVRNYKRKSQQHSWSEESMAAAIQDVRHGILSAKKAAAQYHVPLTILRIRLSSNNEPNAAARKWLGRFRTVFSAEQEKELADYILEMESRLFGLGTRELRHIAFQFAEKNHIAHS
ncbi:unnamed protein product [Acanthoscelides obtectus]|uniref:HTH psq-type domain-containing protein n=1 Tax=Acanthoscelides obtectus TaxID=200917 RepID=A0A9P0K1L4_ACAOB|nr:unnamed protein product [Acanthoscelides obtectus]CAK1657074.1 hypothetical protein AOBTE_LOCUS20103 [Acanthoscelides obtectus]